MSKISSNCKYLQVVYTTSFRYPAFHTSRTPVMPNMGREEDMQPDYLKSCLRPATSPISDLPTLAGDPRRPNPTNQGVKPEIFEKWNQRPSKDLYKEWAKFSVFY